MISRLSVAYLFSLCSWIMILGWTNSSALAILCKIPVKNDKHNTSVLKAVILIA